MLAQQGHPLAGRRGGQGGQAHGGANLLPGGDGGAKQGLQHGVGGSRLPGQGDGPLDLGQNLVLAPHPGAQTCRHLHQVFHRLAPLACDKGGGEGGELHPGGVAQHLPRVAGVFTAQVDFRAVAGGQNHTAVDVGQLGDVGVQPLHVGGGEGQGLPQVDGGQMVFQAGHDNEHR